MFEKDIRFPEKKVDNSWKESVDTDRAKSAAAKNNFQTSVPFLNLIKSLATQALLHLGEIPNPMTGQVEKDPAAAKEMIDLIISLKEKTDGRLSSEEENFMNQVITEIQLKSANLNE